jgi:hypothetical protein
MKEPAGWTGEARGQCCRIRLRPAARIVCAVPRPQASATSKNRRTRLHPSRRDHARNHGGSEDEDFRSSAGELHHGGARQYPTSQPVLSRRRRSRRQKLGDVSIAVESKQLQVISSPTRNRAVQWWHSRSLYVVVAERALPSVHCHPSCRQNIVRLTGANGKTDDDLRPSLLLRGGTP